MRLRLIFKWLRWFGRRGIELRRYSWWGSK
jgi:hypothetical protein